MAKTETAKMDPIVIKDARVINHSCFVKDAFDDKAVPSYKIEVAVPADSEVVADLENQLLDFADAKWGDGAGDDEDLVLPLLDGDKLARKREKKGKEGDAYKGMIVIRANTIYNKDGTDGPGGIQVFDQDVEEISPARSSDLYPGCKAEIAVTISGYENNEGNNALKFYLSAVQKVGDGEKLVTGSDRSTLFKAVGRSGGGESGGRKRRRSRG